MERRFWNEQIETIPKDELRELQWKKLKKEIRYVYYNSELYRNKFREIGTHPDEIKNIEEFRQLPPKPVRQSVFTNNNKDRVLECRFKKNCMGL